MKIHRISSGDSAFIIDPSVDIIIWNDHMPDVAPAYGTMSLDKAREEYFGKNTIIEMFNNQGLNYKDYFFVFDNYLNLEGFDQHSFFYPRFFLNVIKKFLLCSPNHKIDFTTKKNSVNCLMHKHRSQRLLASCWFANNPVKDLLYTQFWAHDKQDVITELDEMLQLSNLTDWTHNYGPKCIMLKSCHGAPPDLTSFNFKSNNMYEKNAMNFFENIANMYYRTVFSVTLEPVFWERGSHVTEKYVNAIYGGTIPIVNGYRVYDDLNKLGFDTFSDIIDTSSQHELDPIMGVWNMLEKNKNVFAKWKEIISDSQIQKRIANNLDLIKCPDKIFKNFLETYSGASLQKVLDIKDLLKTLDFPYIDMLNDSDIINK